MAKAKTRDRSPPIHDHCLPPKGVVIEELASYGRNYRWFDAHPLTAKPALAFIGLVDGAAVVFVAKCACKDYSKCPRSVALEMACNGYGSASVRECDPIKVKPKGT